MEKNEEFLIFSVTFVQDLLPKHQIQTGYSQNLQKQAPEEYQGYSPAGLR